MRIKTPLLAAIAGLLFSCEKLEKKEEVVYKGNTLVVENYAKTTLETTIRSKQIYLISETGEKKILVGFGSMELTSFPYHINELNLEFVVFTPPDQYITTPDDGPVENMTNTLYMDPSIFTKEEYQLVVDFIRENKKKFNEWLDSDVLGLTPGDSYHKINAVVYHALSSLESEYRASEGADYVRIRVNHTLYMRLDENGLQMEGNMGYRLENDTLYYPDYEDKKKVERILTFKSKEGLPFGEKVRAIVSVQPQ